MSEKLTNIIEQLKTLTLLEAAELVKQIEEKFGVDTSVSSAPVMGNIGSIPASPPPQVTRYDHGGVLPCAMSARR